VNITSRTGRQVAAAIVVALSILGGPLLAPAPTAAHPGGLNAAGCHMNRKTGDYHCHRATPAAAPAAMVAADTPGVIKKSQSGICHAPGTTYYAQTLRFTPYETLAACLASGGRLPRR
jgi:hypothetical protein